MQHWPLSATRCQRLAMQGITGFDADTLAVLAPWLRSTPALCGIGIALGTVFASVWILIVMAILAALGAILPLHPFDVLYNYGVRFLTWTPILRTTRHPAALRWVSVASA